MKIRKLGDKVNKDRCDNRTNRKLGINEEVTHCVICKESFDEDWVQCIECEGWAHVECTDQENMNYFTCDVCTNKI